MDHLWTPWRYGYITAGTAGQECVFCSKQQAADRDSFVVFRGEHNFIMLNLYPYNSGHVMIAPYAHIATLEQAEPATREEMMRLTARCEAALRALYKPDGVNLGMNIGACAGAGVAGHIHMHVLPRWCGDASFISVIGETRVLPEELPITWDRLKRALGE
ncbi:MAG: HIT domain-containing protein [Bryobacterales bacterium]|nr:HIT domain-containing protein [Bryobacterales bacterium]MBV9396682.1 HIT domain-containing protein [Bryobacterales bacterium]